MLDDVAEGGLVIDGVKKQNKYLSKYKSFKLNSPKLNMEVRDKINIYLIQFLFGLIFV